MCLLFVDAAVVIIVVAVVDDETVVQNKQLMKARCSIHGC